MKAVYADELKMMLEEICDEHDTDYVFIDYIIDAIDNATETDVVSRGVFDQVM